MYIRAGSQQTSPASLSGFAGYFHCLKIQDMSRRWCLSGLNYQVQLWLPQHGHFIICWNSPPTGIFIPNWVPLLSVAFQFPFRKGFDQGFKMTCCRHLCRFQSMGDHCTQISARNLYVTLYSFGWRRKRGEPCLRKEHQQITMVLCQSMRDGRCGSAGWNCWSWSRLSQPKWDGTSRWSWSCSSCFEANRPVWWLGLWFRILWKRYWLNNF